MQSVGS